jgi:transcriptional regulator with XRE-family HTH domain
VVKRVSPVDVRVGRRLKERRNALGITQENLADGVGLTFQQIQKYEKGANRISASRLQQFANILKIEVTWFFEGTAGSQISDETESLEGLKEFMKLSDGHQLMKAFVKIRDKGLRRLIARLVERLAS